MDYDDVPIRNSNESYLFLVHSYRKNSTSSDMAEREVELVPFATERRYAKQACSFIRSSSSPRLSTSSEMIGEDKIPQTASISETSAEGELLQPVAYNPRKSEALQMLHEKTAASGEFLLPSVYDPNEYAEITDTRKGHHQIHSNLSPKCVDVETGIPLQHFNSIDDLGFEGLIRIGLPPLDEAIPEHGCDADKVPQSAQEKPAFKIVNVQRVGYQKARPEIHSVYADVYASNPFLAELGTDANADLSIRGTLFPSKKYVLPDSSGPASVTPPETPNKPFSDSSFDQNSEDDMATITEDFHRALSSIVKKKARPSFSASELPAKAMSLLGQTQHLKDTRPYSNAQEHAQKQSSLLNPLSDISNGLFGSHKSWKGNSGRSQKEPLKDAPGTNATQNSENSTTKKHARPTKLQSILGINIPPRVTITLSPVSDSGKDASRTNSTLYDKLFSQVLRPSGFSGSDDSYVEHMGIDVRRSSMQGRFDGEPVKRLSSSSNAGTPTCRMPFDSFDSKDYGKNVNHGSAGNTRVSSSAISGSRKESFHSHSDTSFDRYQTQDAAAIWSKFHKELMKNEGDFIKAASTRPSTAASRQQFKRLGSALEPINTTISLDQGLPYKRPKSPVKKMFSSTVEKIGRIIPASNNVTSAQETAINSTSELKISIHPADQNRLFGDLEYIIQDTANRFLLYQHSHSRISPQSIDKTARNWRQKNRPQVAQFLYPISIQRKLVEQNLDTITFHGPLAGNATAITAIMHTWKYVAQELAVRSFCLPDAGLQHFLREATRLLELLGVTAGHMLHFQAWNNVVCQTVHANYQNPYSPQEKSFE